MIQIGLTTSSSVAIFDTCTVAFNKGLRTSLDMWNAHDAFMAFSLNQPFPRLREVYQAKAAEFKAEALELMEAAC